MYNVWTLKFRLDSIVVLEIQNILVLKRLQTYQVSPSIVIILAYVEKIRQTHMNSTIKTLNLTIFWGLKMNFSNLIE